jgi:uncharacterized protein YukE
MAVLSGQDIYWAFTRAEGCQAWQAAQTAARELAGNLADQSVSLNRVLAGMESTWAGAASDASRHSGTRLAAEVATAADALEVTQDVLDRQVESWHTALHGVVPVPDPPTPANPVQALANGGPTQHQRWQRVLDAAGHNVTVYENYQAASAEHRARLPTGYGDQLRPPGTVGPPARPVAAGGAPLGSWAPEPEAEGEVAGGLPEGVHGAVPSADAAGTAGADGGAVVGRHDGGRRDSGRSALGRRVSARRAVTGRGLTAARTARGTTGRRAARPAGEPSTEADGYPDHTAPGPFGLDDGAAPPVIGG